VNKPTATDARARFSYDQETGHLTRRAFLDVRGQMFTRGAGRVVTKFNTTGPGYLQVSLCGRPYLVHRVVYLMMTGRWPRKEIDHINGDRTDNRWVNLRVASRSQNGANKGISQANNSGYKGVHLCSFTGLWRARIKMKGKSTCLGRFPTPEEAHAAYVVAAKRVHGPYARAE
jgi:hypothetical protein